MDDNPGSDSQSSEELEENEDMALALVYTFLALFLIASLATLNILGAVGFILAIVFLYQRESMTKACIKQMRLVSLTLKSIGEKDENTN